MSEASLLKILIISDTHGRKDRIESVIKQVGRHDLLIHAGDHADDVLGRYPKALAVCGNCDAIGSATAELEHEHELLGVKTLILHGHTVHVKTSPLPLVYRAAELSANLVIFGHTHTPTLMVEDGRVFLNPGSLSYPRGYTECTYALLQLRREGEQVQAQFAFYTLDGKQIPAFDLTHQF